jgi:hypothetical protein
MNESRGPWYLLTGLLIGLVAGIVYTWFANPGRFVDTDPSSLRPEFKDEYRGLVAEAYQVNNDLGRARLRLGLLKDKDPQQALAEQASRLLAADSQSNQAKNLSSLASALKNPPAVSTVAPIKQNTQGTAVTEVGQPVFPSATLEEGLMVKTPTPGERTPVGEFTQRPTQTLRPTLSAPFAIEDQTSFCDADTTPGLLQVEVYDNAGRPVSGVRITITWEGGQESFYTGLYPRISPGYADYVMEPGILYSLQVAEGGEIARDISAQPCSQVGGEGTSVPEWGAVKIKFSQE